MSRYLYLIMNICVFFPLFIFSIKKFWKISVNKSILYSYLFISLSFIIWDIIVTRLGHWSFSPKYTLSNTFFGIPFEELMFFFTVPFGCMYVWEILKTKKPDKRLLQFRTTFLSLVALILFGTSLLIFGGRYSQIAGALLILTSVFGYYLGWLERVDFWKFQLIILILFILFNTILTSLPIVSYSYDAIWGLRFITIPIEDFAYNFVLINLSLFIYEGFK